MRIRVLTAVLLGVLSGLGLNDNVVWMLCGEDEIYGVTPSSCFKFRGCRLPAA